MTTGRRTGRRHVLTISVEDYFHAGSLSGSVRPKHWDRFESRLSQNLEEVFKLLNRHGVKGTFFVLGCIADRQPQLVARIYDEGHEIATSGYWPRGLHGMLRDEFREDLRRSKRALEAAGSNRIIGYRSPQRWLTRDDLWVLDVLIDEGFQYDSSINPILRRFAGDPRVFGVHTHRHSANGRPIWEVPISTVSLAGLRVAISGGNYFRQIPNRFIKRWIERWDRQSRSPLVFYFMPWEIDRNQPQFTSISWLTRIRHYRNLDKTRWVLEQYFQQYEFEPIAAQLGLEWRTRPEGGMATLRATPAIPDILDDGRPAVTVVVPLFNEAANVGYLRRSLVELRERLANSYRVHLVLVDDGSTDGTVETLAAEFEGTHDCRILPQPANRGVAAAILEGVRNAPTEIVCSIDCDCSYDPNELVAMIPLAEHADLVTASPYHPDGRVFNVPRWRLALSRTLSLMYSALLRDRFYTYTSCCRVYRRSAVADLVIKNGNFLGVAETLIRLKLAGGRVLEHPATLESRLFGESKMKILKTMRAHGTLLWELALRPISGRGAGGSKGRA